MFGINQFIKLSNYLLAKFQGLNIGCIEANVCKKIVLKTRWKALDEIYQIYMRPYILCSF